MILIKCVFMIIESKCKEEYKSCSSYNNVQGRNEQGCKAITLYNSDKQIDYYNVCIYNEKGSCTEKKLEKCEDYDSGKDTLYCTKIKLSVGLECQIKDNKCIEHYTSCPKTSDKEICLAKPHITFNKKCVFDDDKKTVQR